MSGGTDVKMRAHQSFTTSLFHNVSGNPMESPFYYQGHSATPLYAFDQLRVEPKLDNNNLSNFELDKDDDMIGRVQLVWTRGPLTVGGSTYRRYVDYLAYAEIEEIRVRYGNNFLQTIHGEDLFLYRQFRFDYEDELSEDVRVAGGLTSAERDTVATADQELILDVPLFWTSNPRKYFPIKAMGFELDIEIKWKSADSFIQSDGGGAITSDRSDVHLICWYYRLGTTERNHLTQRIFSDDGVAYLIDVIERQKKEVITVPPAGQYRSIKLDNPISESAGIFFYVRIASEAQDRDPANFRAWENLQPIVRFSVVANNRTIWDATNDKFARFCINPMYFKGTPGQYIYFIPFGLDIQDRDNNWGSKPLSQFNNLRLLIEPQQLPAVDLEVDIFSYVRNIF